MTEAPSIWNKLAHYVLSDALAGNELAAAMPKKRKRTKSKIIRRIRHDGREHYLHATKGWKSRRL